MRHLQIIIILTILTINLACKDTNSPESEETPAVVAVDSSESSVVPPAEVLLYARVNRLRLREKPDTKSKVLAELAEGDVLNYLHEQTAFTKKVTLRDKVYDEPWLKVRTSKGQMGWVYGGGVEKKKPILDASPAPYDKCFEQLIDGMSQEDYSACAERIAHKQVKKNQQYVSRSANGVVFRLLSGERKELKNKSEEEAGKEVASYHYRQYIPQMGFFVVRAHYYEDSGFLLINDKSGRETHIWGYPKPSPDFRHLLVVTSSKINVFQRGELQLWGFTESKGFQKLWEKYLPDDEPGLGIWLDSNTAEIPFTRIRGAKEGEVTIMQLTKNELGSWTLKEKVAG